MVHFSISHSHIRHLAEALPPPFNFTCRHLARNHYEAQLKNSPQQWLNRTLSRLNRLNLRRTSGIKATRGPSTDVGSLAASLVWFGLGRVSVWHGSVLDRITFTLAWPKQNQGEAMQNHMNERKLTDWTVPVMSAQITGATWVHAGRSELYWAWVHWSSTRSLMRINWPGGLLALLPAFELVAERQWPSDEKQCLLEFRNNEN